MISWNNWPSLEVAETPPEFDRRLHQRVNRALLAQHLLGLAAGCIPWAAFHFVRGVLGALSFSLTGRFPGPPNRRNENSL